MLIGLIAVAMAQDVPASVADLQINGNLLRPAIGSSTTLWAEDSATKPDGYVSGRTFFHYANRPLRAQGDDGTEVLVQDVVGLDVAGAVHFRGLRLGAHAPVYAWTSSPYATDQPGIGDLTFDLQGQLFDRDVAPVGVALAGRLLLPTSSVEAPLGAASTGWELAAIVDKPIGPVTLVANLGTRGVPRQTWNEMVWDDQVFLRAGAGWAITEDYGVSGELGAQTNWSSGDNPAGTAAELLGGGWYGLTRDLVLRGGASAGLGRAPGTPVGRVLVGIGWQPDPYPDQDLDGIVDKDDWCPHEPEDVDGFEDGDGCMDRVTAVAIEARGHDGEPIPGAVVTLTGPEDHTLDRSVGTISTHRGQYVMRIEAPGYTPWEESIDLTGNGDHLFGRTLTAEVGSLRVWAVDEDGDALDAMVQVSGGEAWPADGTPIEVPPGEHALVITSPGRDARTVSLYVEPGTTREYSTVVRGGEDDSQARLESDRIEIDEQVHFDLNLATIRPESHGLLDEVAGILLEHPEVTRVRIEGHTDDKGPARFNQKLSEERAESVRRYLIGKGVAPERLRSVGFGPTRPLHDRDTDEARAANRRVEFHLES